MEKFDKTKPYNPKEQKNNATKTLVIICSFLAIVLFFAVKCSCNDNVKEKDIEETKTYTKEEAQMYSQGYIENYKISSFLSSEFKSDTTGVTRINDTVFTVKSRFNYKDKSGELLEAKYNCKIIFYPSDRTQEIKDVVME